MSSYALRSRVRSRRLLAVGVSAALALFGAVTANPEKAAAALASTPHYSLPLALQESLYFYDAQKSGPSRSLNDQPLQWRGDSEPTDAQVPLTPMAKNVGTNLSAAFISAHKSVLDPNNTGYLNLSGGFHDAGDHVKFGLPQSYTASVLGWGLYEFPSAFTSTGTQAHLLDEMRWFSDYFLRSTYRDASGNVVAFAYQVGEGAVDHDYWGPSELQDATTHPRPAYLATADTPASDQTSGAAAALAVESLLVKTSDPAYSAKALSAAQALYSFSVAHRGLGYSGGFYNSSYDQDELSWAAAWLYVATGTRSYLTDIIGTDSSGNFTGWVNKLLASTGTTWQNIWVMSWDTKWGGVFSLIDPLVQADTATPDAVRQLIHYFDKWQIEYWSHVPHDNANDTSVLAWTPAGFGVLTTWGSARYNTAAQLEALAYRKSFPSDPKSAQFTDWAMGQMNYIMGDNPLNRSYIVGFGSTTPGVGSQVGGSAVAASHPHHADAHGSLTNNQDDPATDRHILWGGLVGGPDAADKHNDITTDFVLNEVAIDYNAALPGALAGLYQYYGQNQPMTNFTPPVEPDESPYFTTATLNQDSSQGTQLTVNITNTATHPPHFQTDLSARVYFNIHSLVQHGQDISAISTPVYYDAASQIDGHATSVSAPVRWGDASSCLYYVSIAWTGDNVGLPPSRAFQFGINSAIGSDYLFHWSSSGSPGLTGLAAGTYTNTPDPNIPVYSNGTLVYGQEPSTTADESCGSGGSNPGDPGTGTPAVTAKYRVSATASSSAQITNQISLANTGTSAMSLANITIRYWFTEDGTQPLVYSCDYAPVGCANVTGTFGTVSPTRTGADHYLQLSFKAGAGSIAPGAETGGIQNRINQANYAAFNQSDDYSFNATYTSLTAWTHVTVYNNGVLIYGTEPA